MEKKITPELQSLIASSILSNTHEAIYYKDLDSKFIAANQYQLDYFGLSTMDEIIGTSDFDYFTKEHALVAYNDEQEIIRTGNPKLGIIEQETWNNNLVSYVLTSKYPLYDHSGTIIGTWGHSVNVASANDNKGALKNPRIVNEELARELSKDSKIDSLTGLPNVKAFYEVMNLFYQKALNAMSMPETEYILTLIDMNSFTMINENYSIKYGDQALKYAAKLLGSFTNEFITLYRYSGDKFAMLIENHSYDESISLSESILKVFENHSFKVQDTTIHLNASIGMSRLKESLPFGNVHDIVNLTDKRLYAAKTKNKPTIIFDNTYRL